MLPGEYLNCDGCKIRNECGSVHPFVIGPKPEGIETAPPCGKNLGKAMDLLRRWISGCSGDHMAPETRECLKCETIVFIDSVMKVIK